MKDSFIVVVLGAILLTALTTYALTINVVSKGEPNYQIVYDTVYLDLSRVNKEVKGKYQVEAFYDTQTLKDSLAIFRGPELIGVIPIGEHGVDSVITQDNL